MVNRMVYSSSEPNESDIVKGKVGWEIEIYTT